MKAASELLEGVRSILETPILDAHKWAKVHDMAVDAVLLDLEDSVAPERKEEARARVAQSVDDPSDLGGSLGLPRVNSLNSQWGYDDLTTLAQHDVKTIVYPKVRTAGELVTAGDILREHGSNAGIIPVIETAQAVLELGAIARESVTAGLLFGPSDLAEDVGWALLSGEGLFDDVYYYPKSKLVLTAAAFGLPVYDMVFVADLRDTDQVKAAARKAKAFGFTGMATFYPPHLEVINSTFTPSPEAIAEAREIVAAYEAALARGEGALQMNGRAIIVQDYKRARRLLAEVRN
jgi:citrate lyase beta subunit